MDRRKVILTGAAAAVGAAAAPSSVWAQPNPDYRTPQESTYDREEILRAGSDALGVTAEAIGAAIERIARDYGDSPSGYIAGEEGSGAIVAGLRYGKGLLYMRGHQPKEVYWRGPSVGWDWGGNASRVFTLCYGLPNPDMLFRRYPGVDGSAYLVAGLGVNYQRADDITLAPIRAGVGLRLGANVGYLAYSRNKKILPF